MKQDVSLPLFDSIKKSYAAFFVLFFIGLVCYLRPLYSVPNVEPTTITYYLYIDDFANSFISIAESNLGGESGPYSSSYLAGLASVYDVNNIAVGSCSASFLSIWLTHDGPVYTDISNYLSTDDGLIVTWFTPTTLANLELDSIINGMVTECTVTVTTKVGAAPLFGQTFDLVVSSENGKIYFQFTRIGTIF